MWCKFGKGRNSEYICLWFVIIDLFQSLSFFFFIRKIFILGAFIEALGPLNENG